jgi:hypothetical protein
VDAELALARIAGEREAARGAGGGGLDDQGGEGGLEPVVIGGAVGGEPVAVVAGGEVGEEPQVGGEKAGEGHGPI